MTLWDVVNNITAGLLIVTTVLIWIIVFAALVLFVIGFSKYGVNFIKYGFKQRYVEDLGAKIDGLRNEFCGELETIKVNHFGHLKNFLTELTSIMVDRNVFTNGNF
jgi:hypothetical protein